MAYSSLPVKITNYFTHIFLYVVVHHVLNTIVTNYFANTFISDFTSFLNPSQKPFILCIKLSYVYNPIIFICQVIR